MKRLSIQSLCYLLLTVFIVLPLPRAPLAQETQPQVNFNFDQVEVRLLARLVGDMTGRRFVVDDAVQGRLTVVSPPRISPEEAYPLFVSVLEAAGYTVVEGEHVTRITALPKSVLPAGSVTDGLGLITRVFDIQHISAVELKPVLQPFVRGGDKGAITVLASANHLIITETDAALKRIETLISRLDKPGGARTLEVVSLQYAEAEDLATQVGQALDSARTAAGSLQRHMNKVASGSASLPADFAVVAVPHANQLVLVGSPIQVAEMKRVVALLDVPHHEGGGNLNVMFLKYLSAEDAAKSLTTLLEKNTSERNPLRVAVVPDAANNALLVSAPSSDFKWVQDMILKLDRMPQQVMIETAIAEVSSGDDFDLGVEWSSVDDAEEGKSVVVGSSRPGDTWLTSEAQSGNLLQGLTLGIARGTTVNAAGVTVPSLPFLLRALSEDREVKILSHVPLWAQNNAEASVSVVDNIPILSSTIEGGSGTSRDVIQNIERIDVGIELKVTPRVNANDEVTMILNPSIEAITDEGDPDTPFTPTISKREVSTTVTVPDRSTIVLSGMIREDRVRVESKIPLLGDIPLLGALFRSTSERNQRTNLLIFVTPHIVTDYDEAQELRKDWTARSEAGLLYEKGYLPPGEAEK